MRQIMIDHSAQRTGENRPNEADKVRDRHQALAILRILRRQPGDRLNNLVLNDLLRFYALDDIQADLREALDRLERSGLIARIDSAPEVIVVELTQRGEQVASGQATADGVERARPGASTKGSTDSPRYWWRFPYVGSSSSLCDDRFKLPVRKEHIADASDLVDARPCHHRHVLSVRSIVRADDRVSKRRTAGIE
ncbi:VpaChn25_0724 family phage protein [Jiella pacifica]|uniref:VpaChn25_0724 family phage protein n=1 Tax=Jiella pacifica TaxID=2696469 RepID=UPI00406BBC6B